MLSLLLCEKEVKVLGKKVDIRGHSFGSLVGIEPTKKRDDSGSVIWKLECDCGNEYEASVRYLRYKKIKSCGKCLSVEYEFQENIVIGKVKTGASFIIDSDDFIKISKHSWWQVSNGYFVSRINGNYIGMHRFIMNVGKSKSIIDHINRNTTDNRKENLRIADQSGNGFNSNNNKAWRSSKYRGVSWNKGLQKWESYITYYYKKINLGYYISEEKAAVMYNCAVNYLAPEFAVLNDVPESPPHIKKYVYEKCKGYLIKKKVAV